MTEPRVSICLPVYNGVDYLGAALESVLAQTFGDFELLIRDDQSSDGSFQLLEAMAKTDKRIKLSRNEKRQGLFNNYNKTLQDARGEFIKPFAQDDLLHPDFLKYTVALLDQEPSVSLVSTDRTLIDASGQEFRSLDMPPASEIFPDRIPVAGYDAMRQCLFPVVNYIGEPSAVIFRRSAMGQGFDVNFYHIGDLEYWLRILQEGDFILVHEALTFFRCHSKSCSAANARAITAGADIVRLSKKFAWVLEELGHTESEFLGEAIGAFASYLRILKHSQAISLDDLRDEDTLLAVIDNSGPREDQGKAALKLALAYRELAFHALSMSNSLNQPQHWSHEKYKVFQDNASKIAELELNLRELLDSSSWLATKPLRELNGVFSDNEPGRLLHIEIDMNGDVEAQQREYIEYLEELKGRILASRSWRYTAPLRALNLLR